jgi:WD40 repeat protein
VILLLVWAVTLQESPAPGASLRIGEANREESADARGVRFLRFSPDGKTLTSGSNATVCRWDSVTGRRLSRFQPFEILSMDTSPDGTVAAIGDSAAEAFALFDLESGKELWKVVQHDQARTLTFSTDGKTLAEGG